MARDPDQGSAYVFDLVEHDAADVVAPPAGDTRYGTGHDAVRNGAADDEPSAGELPHASRGPGSHWRAALSVSAVLAIALGTGIASDGVRDSARIERMRGIDGGVADLSAPLEEAWVWDGIIGGGRGAYQDVPEVVVLGDLMVFVSDRELVALDPGTGREAWAVPLGDDAECGPMGGSPYDGRPTASASSVVCLHGGDKDREVVVVGPDGGATAARTLDPSDTRRYGAPRPGPDGTVLRAMRVGPPSEVDLGDATCDDTGECNGTVRAGRDVELRAEDAVTGGERWSVTIPFRAAGPIDCWDTAWDDPSNLITFDGSIYPDAFGAWITPDLVNLRGCGVRAAVTPVGVVLGGEGEWGTATVESLGDGRYAWLDYGRASRTVVYSADGTIVGEYPGFASGPRASDGSAPGTLLADDGTGQRLTAYAPDGTRLWTVGAIGADRPYLAQVGQTMVVNGEGMGVRGLDAATGAERWRWDDPEGGAWVLQAFTDGRSVLLVLTPDDSGLPRMVSLDVATGEVLWREMDRPAPNGTDHSELFGTLVAVDGHLLEFDQAGVRGLG